MCQSRRKGNNIKQKEEETHSFSGQSYTIFSALFMCVNSSIILFFFSNPHRSFQCTIYITVWLRECKWWLRVCVRFFFASPCAKFTKKIKSLGSVFFFDDNCFFFLLSLLYICNDACFFVVYTKQNQKKMHGVFFFPHFSLFLFFKPITTRTQWKNFRLKYY